MHKILLVEDDEVIRQQVKKMLEQWGYEVVLVFQRSGHGYRYGNQYGWGRLCD